VFYYAVVFFSILKIISLKLWNLPHHIDLVKLVKYRQMCSLGHWFRQRSSVSIISL